MGKHSYTIAPGTPTQVAHPWRAVVRTVFQALIGVCVLLPAVVETAGLGTVPWIAGAVADAGAVTKIMALPQVEEFLTRFVPFLATGVETEATVDVE